jgi:hypothetical protein
MAGRDVVITPAIAANSSRYCSTAEYRSLKEGTTQQRVARILDGSGKREGRYTIGKNVFETRQYGADDYSDYDQ